MHRNFLAKAIFKFFEQMYGKGKDARCEGRMPMGIIFFEQEVVFNNRKLRLCLIKHEKTRILNIFDDELKTEFSQGKIFSVMSCLFPTGSESVETQFFHHEVLPQESFVVEIHKLLDYKDPKLKTKWPQVA